MIGLWTLSYSWSPCKELTLHTRPPELVPGSGVMSDPFPRDLFSSVQANMIFLTIWWFMVTFQCNSHFRFVVIFNHLEFIWQNPGWYVTKPVAEQPQQHLHCGTLASQPHLMALSAQSQLIHTSTHFPLLSCEALGCCCCLLKELLHSRLGKSGLPAWVSSRFACLQPGHWN